MIKRSSVRISAVFLMLFVAFFIAIVLNINTGSVHITPVEIVKIIVGGPAQANLHADVVWRIRLPRLLAAAVLGGALSVAGFLLQTFFRNPIAGPFVLGISSGAKLFVSFVMIVLLKYFSRVSPYTMVAASFLGALAAMGLVLMFARKAGSMSMLLVIGIMIGYICSAATDFLVTFAKETDIAVLHSWSMGRFGGIPWSSVGIATAVILPTVLAVVFFSKPIDAYLMGEGYAQSMGINIKTFRVILILLSSLLAACVTAFAGPISFVGIAVPHITKLLVGTSKSLIVVPGCFMAGAVFCMLCDLLARTAFAPTELAIGTVTAVFGAPIVIWLMVSRRKRG